MSSRSQQRLTGDENEALARLVGPRCQSLGAARAQLHVTEGPHHYRWASGPEGVVSLIKDGTQRSLYFRLFDLHKQTVKWEQDLRRVVKLDSPPFKGFLSFHAESCHVGLRFAEEEQALDFFKLVEGIVVGESRKNAFSEPEPVHNLSNRRHSLAVPTAVSAAETKSSKQSNGNVAKSLFYRIKKGKLAKKEAEIRVVEVQKVTTEIDMEDEDTRNFMARYSTSASVERNNQPEVLELGVSSSAFVDTKEEVVRPPEPVPRQMFAKKGSPNLNKAPTKVPPQQPPLKAPRAPPRKIDEGREKSVDAMETEWTGEIQIQFPEGDFVRDQEVLEDLEVEGSSEA